MLAMAVFLIGSIFLRAPWLYQEKRWHPRLGRYGVAAPIVVGVAFGFGWSPCFGPILGSILGIAATQQRVLAGGTLLAVYSIGLGLPFLVAGLALDRAAGTLGWVKRHYAAFVIGSALGARGVRDPAHVRRAEPPLRRPPTLAHGPPPRLDREPRLTREIGF